VAAISATSIAQGLGGGDKHTRGERVWVCRGPVRGSPGLGSRGMGSEAATFSGLAGMGDLIGTCIEPR